MSRQFGSLHRSNSHPTNLNTPITIIPLFAFPPPNFPTNNITSGMNSDTNSHISVLYSISQLNNPNIETPDEFADSEPSPSKPTQTIFKPTPQFFQNPLFNQSHQINHSHPFLHPLMLHKSPQPTLHFIQTDHPILQIFPKSPKN